MSAAPILDWERAWAPYDASTYDAALSYIRADDVVLDIGAGDLRFARRVAAVARRVIAVECQSEPLARRIALGALPRNLEAVRADALTWPFPAGVSVAVLLMRHCRHYVTYAHKLRQIGCERLITNTRWRMGIELVYLNSGVDYAQARIGWYACACCGQAGFIPGPPEALTPDVLEHTHNVLTCPACDPEQPARAQDYT
jgi:SAM-dependent methyltransferase